MSGDDSLARIRKVALAMACATVVVLSACGAQSGDARSVETATNRPMIPWCDDVELAGPVRDAPPGISMNADPIRIAVLETYGEARPETYAGVYLDRESGGTAVVAFTDAPEPHRAALLERAPSATDVPSIQPRPTSADGTTLADADFAFDVVQVAHTKTELEAVQTDVETTLGSHEFALYGVGQSPQLNRVAIEMGVVDDDTRAALADRFPVDEVCVNGTDAASVTTLDPAVPTTLFPPVGQEATLTCSGFTFPSSALDQAPGFETTDDPLAEAFRAGLATDPMLYRGAEPAGGGWILLAREDDRALLATGTDQIQTVTMEFPGRRWIWSGSGGCNPTVALPGGLGPVRWALAESPAPTDTELHLFVTEQGCGGGEPIGDRLVGPDVRETGDRILIAFAARPLAGGFKTCPGIPPEQVTVTLSSAVGARQLLDGLTSFGG